MNVIITTYNYNIIQDVEQISFICQKGNIIYTTLKEKGFFDKYYPDRYK